MGCGASSAASAQPAGAQGAATAAVPEPVTIRFEATVAPDSSSVPAEFGESAEYYFIVLELPGFSGTDDVTVNCQVAPDGYSVAVDCVRRSAVEERAVEVPISTRLLGPINWKCELTGVYDRQPEFNCHDGLLKIRFRKRLQLVETLRHVDF